MKPAHPPPFDLNSDAAGAGCLSGVVRRLLCAGLRSNVPGDGGQMEGVDRCLGDEWKAMQKKNPPATPCIVARLMGLDSMPVFPYTPPESVRRSRSTNSVESWPGFLCGERSGEEKIRTSASFREAPTYLRQENEDFLILSFTPEDKAAARIKVNGGKEKANAGDAKERKKETSRTEKRVAEKNKRKELKNSQKEHVAERKHSNSKSPIVPSPKVKVPRKSCRINKSGDKVKPTEQKEMPVKPERDNSTKKKIAAPPQTQRQNEAGCSSQETSPVSVLDYPFVDGEYSINFKYPTSEDVQKQQSSRRKLSSKFDRVNSASSSFHGATISRDRDTSLLDRPSITKSSNAEQISLDWSQIWRKICLVTEEDTKNSTWTSGEAWRSEEVGEMVAAVALEILDLVLEEAASEISDLH